MNKFTSDMEVLINEGVFEANNGNIRFVFRYGNRLKGTIDNMGLNERAYNCLRRNGIFNIEGISENWNSLGKLNGMGKKSVKEIKNRYLEYYYGLLNNEEERKQFWRDTLKATIEM